MPEMIKTVGVPVTEGQLAWLEQQSRDADRPVAYIVRKMIEAEMEREAA